MDVADILDAIEASGVEQIEAIRKEAQEKAAALLNTAGENAKAIQKDLCNELVRSAERQRARILHEANLKRLKIEEQARGHLIDKFLEQVRERLQNSRRDERYPDMLRRLTDDAVNTLSSSLQRNESMVVQSDPHDEDLVRKILKELSYDAESKGGHNSWGGVTASSEDGRVEVINTLEARMERVTPYLRKTLSIRLKVED